MNNFDGINQYANNNSQYNPNFNQYRTPAPKKKRRFWRWLLLFLLIIGGAALFGGSKILSKTNQIFTNKQNIFVRVGQLLISDDKPLKGEENGTVNVLLLGMGGPGHEGPYLTDTIMVASFNTNTKEVVFTSIPRDFLVQLQGRGFNKINAAYAYAEMDEQGTGGQAAIVAAEKITGMTIPYYAAVDFKGFVKAVDHVGGLEINVERTFTDSQYPNYNYGYIPPITFNKGVHHMNGETALIFARSRKGNNGEGSDFARSERQKKIMVAFKEEIYKLGVTDIKTMNNLLGDFTENFRTNFEPWELKRLADLAKDVNGDNVYSLSLEPDNRMICDGLIDLNTGRPAAPLPEPEVDEEGNVIPAPAPEPNSRIYVVTTCEGKTLADVSNHLNSSIGVARLQTEKATIEVQNTTGKAYVVEPWRELSNLGINIKFSNSKTPIERGILYDNSDGTMPKTLDFLKTNYNMSMSDLPYTSSTADFVIILGQDAL
ncbi:MAG TPA: LCP family protein [Candidatus Binatia bacterium]|nr:LCP family protein [Candidatus Binatia bacterium]